MALLRSRRLAAILGAPVDQLSAANIKAMVDNRIPEAFDLDFKGTVYGNSDKDRRDLCGDVASLANASGGLIVLGVEEDDHAVASSAPGVELADDERNRMLQIVASGIAPLPAVEIHSVPSTADPRRGWWVVAVPRSSGAPHAVIVNDGFRFPVRHGTTTRYLTEPEIAAEYRRRDMHSSNLAVRLDEVLKDALANVDRNHGAWVVVGLVPEHAGALEISQKRLDEMRQHYAGRELFEVGRAGAHFSWVRTGRGKYTVGDGPHSRADSPLPHYGYAELHTDGAGSYAVQLWDLADRRRQRDREGEQPVEDQIAPDEIIALALLNGLRRLGAHARDTTGAAGAANLLAQLVPSPGRTVQIGHARRFGFAESRSGNGISTSAIAETAASLDDIAEPGAALVATAARLLDELGNSFGIPEMGQLSLDGEIRVRYWQDSEPLVTWAEQHGVDTTDSTIAGT